MGRGKEKGRFTEDEIRGVVKRLKGGKSSGGNGIIS